MPVRVQGSCIGDERRCEDLAGGEADAKGFRVAGVDGPWDTEGAQDDDDEANAEEEAELELSGRW